jgi:hypothetical protein
MARKGPKQGLEVVGVLVAQRRVVAKGGDRRGRRRRLARPRARRYSHSHPTTTMTTGSTNVMFFVI